MNPIDDAPMPPPPGKPDPNCMTRDIEAALERAVRERVLRTARAHGVGLRAAALIVLGEIR